MSTNSNSDNIMSTNTNSNSTNNTINTRFPPEPNGYIHLGHVKAMLIDFDKHPNCNCYLRFDDTNPETEKQLYADQIIEDVKFFGFKPYKITYTSDYFPRLLELAWILIAKELAYVDFSTQEQIKIQRGRIVNEDGSISWNKPTESPYRNNPIGKNIKGFRDMIDGKYKEGECSLRMKMDMTSDNPNMRDLVAYTVKYTPHFRTKTTYNVYPTYEFSHCLVDALENIDYSYCSLEFVTRQESYYWLIDQLNNPNKLIDQLNNPNKPNNPTNKLKRPIVYEFSRLNIKNSILSKRKIKALINDGKISGYDDPRLLTIMGLKRRGYTATSLKDAVGKLGHTRHESTLSIGLLEHSIRNELNLVAPRIFGIMDPLKVIIIGMDNTVFERPIHPFNPIYGTRNITLRDEIYIDRSDFRLEANRKYYRLTKKQGVRLKYADGIIRYDHHDEEDNNITCVYVTYTTDKKTKTKGCLGWVSQEDSILCTFNIYSDLLREGVFNNESLVIKKGLIEKDVKINHRYQIERVGYFIIDRIDTDTDRDMIITEIITNQIVTLRERKDKR